MLWLLLLALACFRAMPLSLLVLLQAEVGAELLVLKVLLQVAGQQAVVCCK
jgi:hypothetical protein